MPPAIALGIAALAGAGGIALPAGVASVLGSVVMAGLTFPCMTILTPSPVEHTHDSLQRDPETGRNPHSE